MYALNELQTLIYKAAVGARLPVGIAQEIAAAGVWLAQRRYPVCEMITRALADAIDASVNCKKNDQGFELAEARAAVAGPSAIDMLMADNRADCEISLNGLDEPLLLLGLVGVAAECAGLTTTISTPEHSFIIGPVGDIDQASFPTHGPIDVSLQPASDDRTTILIAPATRYDPSAISDTGWTQLEQLAHRTYVPATDHSRTSGAGAGLTDND
jgi:hypothetical protein